VRLARIARAGPVVWAIAHGGSQRVGLYDAAGAPTGSIDVTSPMFRLSGVTVKPFTPARDHLLWARENSDIDRVFVFGGVVATSHMVTDVPDD
jgi:hypothetical protein